MAPPGFKLGPAWVSSLQAMATSRKAFSLAPIQSHSQYCAAVNCRNSRDKEPGLSFHYFPKCGKKDKDNTLERLVDEHGVGDDRAPNAYRHGHSAYSLPVLYRSRFSAV